MNWVQTASDVEAAQMKLLYAALYIAVGILPVSVAANVKISSRAMHEFYEPKTARSNDWMAPPSGQKYAQVTLEKRFPSVELLVSKFHKQTKKHSQESLKVRFRQMYRDNPDKMILRYIRAMGDSKKIMCAVGVAICTYYGPYNPVDLLRKGEAHFYFDNPNPRMQNQHEVMKRIIAGHDKQNRPVNVLHARRAFPKHQSHEEQEMFSLYLLELTYLMCQDTVDGAIIIFDLQGLSRANLDSRVMRFIFFQLNKLYPMVLNRLFIYKGPIALQAAFRIMYGWLDPEMRDRVKFINKPDEILAYVSSSQLPTLVGGTAPHKHKWISPRTEDDAPMRDTETRDKLLNERQLLVSQIERLTCEWIMATGPNLKLEQNRRAMLEQFAELYWQLDPYVRSRTVFDRNGIFGLLKPEFREGGVSQPVCKVERAAEADAEPHSRPASGLEASRDIAPRALRERPDDVSVRTGATRYEDIDLVAGSVKPLEGFTSLDI